MRGSHPLDASSGRVLYREQKSKKQTMFPGSDTLKEFRSPSHVLGIDKIPLQGS